jgi:hypothetical protein
MPANAATTADLHHRSGHDPASYWRSIAEAALRGEQLTLEVHCRQVAAVTRETFATVKALGHEVDREQEAA